MCSTYSLRDCEVCRVKIKQLINVKMENNQKDGRTPQNEVIVKEKPNQDYKQVNPIDSNQNKNQQAAISKEADNKKEKATADSEKKSSKPIIRNQG